MSRQCRYCSNMTVEALMLLLTGGLKTGRPTTLFSSRGFYRHHKSFSDLESADANGCHFCGLVLDCFKFVPWNREGRRPWVWPLQPCSLNTSMYSLQRALQCPTLICLTTRDHLSVTAYSRLILDTLLIQVGSIIVGEASNTHADKIFPLPIALSVRNGNVWCLTNRN